MEMLRQLFVDGCSKCSSSNEVCLRFRVAIQPVYITCRNSISVETCMAVPFCCIVPGCQKNIFRDSVAQIHKRDLGVVMLLTFRHLESHRNTTVVHKA